MKESWSKAFLQGSGDVIVSIGKVIFSPPLSEKILEVPVLKWESVLLDALHASKSEESGASIIEEINN